MRIFTYIILILFVSFLATPTIVSVINKSCDTSFFYNITEEELSHKAIKEYKLQLNTLNLFLKLSELSSEIISENMLKHDNFTSAIFSPPPNK